MKLVYVASPFSSDSPWKEEHNFSLATKWIGRLQVENPDCALFAPITQSYTLKQFEPDLGTTFAFWANIDYTFLGKSDELWVLTMDGWKESIGVQAEIKFAEENNIPIKYL